MCTYVVCLEGQWLTQARVLQPVVDFIQQELGGKVSKASVSARLTDSPCILVTSQQGWSANMQRIMKSQPMGDNRAMDYMKGEKIMEINPDNQVCLTPGMRRCRICRIVLLHSASVAGMWASQEAKG